jgi:hypothetical protein
VGGQRTLVRQMIVDIRKVPVGVEFEVQTLAIYWNGLQKADDLWFGAIGYEHSFLVSLLLVFPLEKPVKDFQLMDAPTRKGKPQAFQGRKILLVPEQRDWLYWEIPTPQPGHVYSLHWTW